MFDPAGAGRGIFALTFIARHTWLGDYGGIVTATSSPYDWSITQNGHYFVTWFGGDETVSNWLRWVNNPNTFEQLNVVAVQCRYKMYYITVKDIAPGEELYVFYGISYAKKLCVADSEISKMYSFICRFGGGLNCTLPS